MFTINELGFSTDNTTDYNELQMAGSYPVHEMVITVFSANLSNLNVHNICMHSSYKTRAKIHKVTKTVKFTTDTLLALK